MISLKKKINFFFKVSLIITLIFSIIGMDVRAEQQSKLGLSAHGAVLIDVNSGRILFSRNADEQMRIASLTKIMTAIVAIENGNLKNTVTTSDRAYGVEGSSIYLKRGEKLSLENMLYGLMLRSGNDAAVAIAEHVGGSLEGFVYLMNEKADYIGMSNSSFMNPHGLDHKNHYSTPRDMALLTAYALKNQTFSKIVSTKVKSAPLAGEKWDRKWYNKNKMLSKYPWADGVKTGYTKLARRCLASSATKENIRLAVITLNAPNDWNDHEELLNYGFNNFSQTKIVSKGEVVAKEGELDILAENDFIYPLANSEKELIQKEVILNEQAIEAGRRDIGSIKIYFNNTHVGSVSLKIDKEQEATSSFKLIENIEAAWKMFFKGE